MGESLFYSWLRHIKECQIVQTNWTFPPSQLKHFYLEDKIEKLALSAEDLFHNKLGYDIFGKNTYRQLLKQAEIDVLGVSFDANTDDSDISVYAIDVAFHTNGLNYKNPHCTVEKLTEKYIRSAMCIMGCFGLCKGEIIFASPRVRNSLLLELENIVQEINKLFKSLGLSFVAKLIVNQKFEKSILNEVLLQTNEIADTNELFMRSCQMLDLFNSLKRETATQNAETTISWKINDESELKVGKYIRTTVKQLMEKDLLSNKEIENLKSQEYTYKMFKRNMPFLKEVYENDNIANLRKDSRGYYRYYSELFEYKGRQFLLCQEWNEKVNREPFNDWLNMILGKM